MVQSTLYFQGESPTYILNEDTHPVIRAIGVSHTACKDVFRRNLRSHSWSALYFCSIYVSGAYYCRSLSSPLPLTSKRTRKKTTRNQTKKTFSYFELESRQTRFALKNTVFPCLSLPSYRVRTPPTPPPHANPLFPCHHCRRLPLRCVNKLLSVPRPCAARP